MGLFDGANFIKSSLMASRFEIGFEPDPDDLDRCLLVENPLSQDKDVCIVVTPARLGGDGVMAECRADAGKLVGRNRHPDAGSADENAAIERPFETDSATWMA